MPLEQEFRKLGVPNGGQLERDHPFLCPLDAVFPPERARDRSRNLCAGRKPGLHGIMGQFHRLSARVGHRLDVQKPRRAIRLIGPRRHTRRWYAATAVTFAFLATRRICGGPSFLPHCQPSRWQRPCPRPHSARSLGARRRGRRVLESASLAHARELATEAAGRGDVVVAVGGDGMAGALAGVAAASGARYGLIPAGRGNDLAGVLGIPLDPEAAARVLTGGRLKQIDLISVSSPDQPDVVVAGSVYAGIPAVAGEIANATRWLSGPLVYP